MTNTAVPAAATSLIEIWANVERVLNGMPEHERQEHWDMSTWGEQTTCGTIACAAGHCGLDPWFRERGFTLDFDEDGAAEIGNVEGFFGLEGARRIFFNSQIRPVETVLGEVRDYVSELRKIDETSSNLTLPALGAECPEFGGHFAGLRIGADGEPYALIVGPEFDGYKSWTAAMEWAGSLSVAGHADFTLPDRGEASALFERVKSLFQPSWYWLSEQHAGSSYDAWLQHFGYGYQNGYHKGYDGLRVRAVRRVPIRSFNHSVISRSAS